MDLDGPADLKQKIELLGKERVVVIKIEPKKRIRLDEGPAAHDNLCSPR
jgi:hypothetical protein